jgi:hypothetical protein
LRVVRLALRLRTGRPPAGPGPIGTWTRAALRAEGLDAGLAETLAPLEAAADLRGLAEWLEELLSAVRGYAKPKNAAYGLYLEYIQKHPPGAASASADATAARAHAPGARKEP